ncbi:MAG: MlaD family protein [Rhodospirillales bacterium]|nr:MlaD family protein [Rhodospirillales bacterium]
MVLVVVALAIALAYGGGRQKAAEGYPVLARFNRADGLNLGSDVRMAGVSVGKVSVQQLDSRFRAVVTLTIRPGIPLTRDTAAVIRTDGLLGAKYIELVPGGAEEDIRPGGEITYTQDAMVVQELLELIVKQAQAERGAPPQGEAH